MPRNLPPLPDPTDDTDGMMVTITKVPAAAGVPAAKRVHVNISFPGDPDGSLTIIGDEVTGPQLTALRNALGPFIGVFKTRRGYV